MSKNILDFVKNQVAAEKLVSDIESGNPYNEDFNYLDFHRDRFTYIFDLGKKYFSPGAKFLDIGSLFGYVCLGYQQIGYQSYGLDLAKYVKQFASRFASWSIDNRSCDLTSENLPFADQEFDLILASEILEHFRFHPARFFAEVARVLKPGGRLIITTPNLIRLNNVIKLLLGRSINWDIADQYWDGTHAREFTAAEIAQLAKQTGLAVETVTYRNFSYPNLLPVVKIVNSLFGLLWPKRQGNLIVVLRK